MSESAEGVFTVKGELGLHARPAARFAQRAGDFDAEVTMGRSDGEEWVNGASVLSILSLAASVGTELIIRAEGPDASEAVAQLGALLESDADT